MIPVASFAHSGTVDDDASLKSKILDGERKYAVYLPPDYETSQRSYPVLYLLHGSGDDQTGWIQFGEVLRIADAAIADGSATPMVIIMPDAYTGRRGYQNRLSVDWRYEDFFFEELIPHVEKKYRIKSEKRFRAISGLSMGGYGSFIYALHRPDMFSSAAPLSAGTGTRSVQQFLEREERWNPEVDLTAVPDSVVQAYWERHSVAHMVEALPKEELESVRWYIDCGDDDFLFQGNAHVNITLHEREIPHEFRVRDGGHTWTYWRQSLPEVLRFVSDAFHQY